MLRRLLIIFGYFCLVLALIVFTVVLVAYGKDYTYDFAAHKIIQEGHVIVESVPNGVLISADHKQLKKKTPYQAAYTVGAHTFSLAKDGFWPWSKVLDVVAGRVTLADYVILVPKKPVQTAFDTKSVIVAQTISRDHHHVAYITGGPDPALYTLDLGSRKPVRLYTPKSATPTDPAEVLHDVAWSDDASHLLIVSDVGGQPVHRLASAEGGEPTNLTQVYGFDLTGLRFSGSNWQQLYWISPDGLRRLDVNARTVSGVLADKVSEFWPEPDVILYVQQTDLGRSLWSIDNSGKRQELIQALVESDAYAVAQSQYNGEDVLVVVPSKTQVATLYTGIYGDTPVSKVIARGMTGATFSPDGHFLALTSPSVTRVYDLERSTIEQSFVLYSFASTLDASTTLTWFDDSHLLTVRNGELTFSDFDGTNSVDLGKDYGSIPGSSTWDGRFVVMYQAETAGVKIAELQIRQ
jgi:WD40 repeat protein